MQKHEVNKCICNKLEKICKNMQKICRSKEGEGQREGGREKEGGRARRGGANIPPTAARPRRGGPEGARADAELAAPRGEDRPKQGLRNALRSRRLDGRQAVAPCYRMPLACRDNAFVRRLVASGFLAISLAVICDAGP